jgi:hypothetical protein
MSELVKFCRPRTNVLRLPRHAASAGDREAGHALIASRGEGEVVRVEAFADRMLHNPLQRVAQPRALRGTALASVSVLSRMCSV